MESSIGNIRNLYALLSMTNPGLLQPYKSRIAQQHIVAAKLVTANNSYQATTKITSVDKIDYSFALDLNSKTYQSKGDWIWVTQIEVTYPNETLIVMPINPRVIDIPYSGNKICAHWFFKNIDKELNEQLNSQL